MSQTADDVTRPAAAMAQADDDKSGAMRQTDDDGPAGKRVCTGTVTISTEEYEKLISASAAVQNASSCFICLEIATVPVRFLPCRHELCLRCAGKYVQTRRDCPMCRATIDKVEVVSQRDLIVPDTDFATLTRTQFESIRKCVWPNRKPTVPMAFEIFRGTVRCLLNPSKCSICALMIRTKAVTDARNAANAATRALKEAEKKQMFARELAMNLINKP